MADQSSSKPIGVSDAVREIAAELNEDVARIRVRDETWTRFAQDGILVDLHIGRWRGRAQIELEHLGIRPSSDEERKVLEKALVLGTRWLLPKELMKRAESIESEARYWLERCSFKTFWGRWLHKSRYAEWKERNEQIRATYLALAADIDARWDELVKQVAATYYGLGNQTFGRLNASIRTRNAWVRRQIIQGPPAPTDEELADPDYAPRQPGDWWSEADIQPELDDQEEWVRNFVRQALSQLRSREAVVASFTFDYDAEIIPMAAQVAADQVAARRIRLEGAEAAMLEDIRRTEARRAAEGVNRFVADLKAQVSEQVYGAAIDCLDALKKGDGRLGRNNTRQLKSLVETVSKAVFWEDPNLEARLAELDRVVSVASDKRSESELTEVLQALGAEARIVLTEIDRVGERRARPDLGITDDLGDLERVARRVRTDLDLSEPLDLPALPSRQARGGRRRELDLVI